MINREKKMLLLAVMTLGLKIDVQATLYADNKRVEISTQKEISDKVKQNDKTMISIKNNGEITLKEELNLNLSKDEYKDVERFVNIDRTSDSKFINNGSIKVKDGITTGSMQGGNFINNGMIELNDDSKGIVLTNEGKIENNGTIIINGGDNANAKGVYLTLAGKFVNNKTIKADKKGAKGIQFGSGNSTATNVGKIEVTNGANGVFSQGGNFINSEKGIMEVKSGSTGINLSTNGKAENRGMIAVTEKGFGVNLADTNANFINKEEGKIQVIGDATGVQLGKGKSENRGTIIATGNNAKGTYLNGNGTFINNEVGVISATEKNAKAVMFGTASDKAKLENKGTIKAENGAVGIHLYGGKNNIIKNNGKIDAGINGKAIELGEVENTTILLESGSEVVGKINLIKGTNNIVENSGIINTGKNGVAIETGKDTNNMIVLKEGSSIIGKINGSKSKESKGNDILVFDGGNHSDLNVNNFEKIIAKGNSKVSNSRISLEYNDGTDKYIKENNPNKSQNGNIILEKSEIIVDLTNKKDNSTGVIQGSTVIDNGTKIAFISENEKEFNVSEILGGNVEVKGENVFNNTAVWNYKTNSEGNIIAIKKDYKDVVNKSQLKDFGSVLDKNEANAQGDFKKGMAILSLLNEKEFNDAMTQLSGGVHGYTADFVAINSRTLSNTVKEKKLKEDKTREKSLGSYEQDIKYINNKHKLGGLMDVDYEEKGVLAITEKQISPEGTIGFIYGGAKGDVKFENGKNGSAKLDNIYVGGYYNHEFSDRVSLLSNVNFVYSHTNVSRNIKFAKDGRDINYTYDSTYPVFGLGGGTTLFYNLYDDENNSVKTYGGINWTKIVQGNINENSDKKEDAGNKNLTIKNIPVNEQMYDSVVPYIGLTAQHNGYIFDKKYRIGADISYETELGNIKEGKELKLSALGKNHKVDTTTRENIISYSLNGALDLTEDFTIFADYTKVSSSEYDNDRIGAGFEYKMDRLSDPFIIGPILSKIENTKFQSNRWGGSLTASLETTDDSNRSYYLPNGEHSSGDYTVSYQLKPKLALSLNDKQTKYSYYFETYVAKTGMVESLDKNERRKQGQRIHGEVRWIDTYSRGTYGLNVGYRNEKSSSPRNTGKIYEDRNRNAVHQLRITPNLKYNLGYGFVFGGNTTFTGIYTYRGVNEGNTDLKIESEWGLTYTGFMPRWQLRVNYFRDDTWYDKDSRKAVWDSKGNISWDTVTSSDSYNLNQLRPSATYYFGNGASVLLSARIPLGHGAFYTLNDGNITGESYETRYTVKYTQPLAQGLSGFIGTDLLVLKSKNVKAGDPKNGTETRTYSLRPSIGFTYSF